MAKILFNQEDNRLNYSEMLQPEIGFDLEFAVAFTYSLDLEALIGVPIALGLLDEMDSNLKENPFYLLEAIRKSSDKIAIFCNAGCIALPKNIQSVFALLENSVFDVKLKNKQNFHPKMWFIKYKNESGESYIKLIVLSRNLTFDRSFDIASEMIGEVGKVRQDKNVPLSNMLKFSAQYASSAKKKNILSLAEEILYVKKFELDEPFEDYEFIPLGINKAAIQSTMLHDTYNDIFVVSPFLSAGIVSSLTSKAKRKILITRKSSVTKEIMASFDSVYITKDIILDAEMTSEDEGSTVSKQDIHAKIYFTSSNNGNNLYLGSANASQNAFYNNVEFLLKLTFSKKATSFQAIVNDFLPIEGCPFEEMHVLGDEVESDKNELLDKCFKDAIWSISHAQVTEEDDAYSMTVYSGTLKIDKKVYIAPLFRGRSFVLLEEKVTFKKMLLKELCAFYIIKIEDKQVVVKISTDGISSERDQAIYKHIIQTSSGFLAYITFILSDNYAEAYFEQKDIIKNLLNGEKTSGTTVPAALYERMLQTAFTNPNKLLEIDKIIEKLDAEIVTEDFNKMYSHFKEVAMRLTK